MLLINNILVRHQSSRIKYKIDRLWDNFRRRCQRFKRGYAYSDVWDINVWFMRTVKPMLIHLRDHGIGIPGELVVDGENQRANWENVLTEMINCLDMMDEDNVYESLGFYDYDQLLSIEDYKRVGAIMEENKNRFFELFSKYFFSLWD